MPSNRIKDRNYTNLLKNTKSVFSEFSSESISDKEAIEIINSFQSLLQLLDNWEDDGDIMLEAA